MNTSGKSVRSRLICFGGTTPNIGTTCLSFGTAMHIARLTENKVGYLCLNLKSSKLHRYLGKDHPVMSLDRMRVELKSRSLTEARLLQHCDQLRGLDNLYLLYGNLLRDQAEYFLAEDIEQLLSTAASTFDLCIVEVSAYWDNAATVCAMQKAADIIIVTTPELTHFQEDFVQWVKGFAPVIGVGTERMQLMITQYDATRDGYRMNEIAKETGLPLIGSFPVIPELLPVLNEGKLHVFLQNHREASSYLSTLAKQWISTYSLALKPAKASQHSNWMRKVLSTFNLI